MKQNKIKQALEYLPKHLGESFCQLFLLLTVAGAIIPNWDYMPQVGLDPSWIFALSQSISQGLIFGKDVIFTFGPYAPLYTNLYHPEMNLSLFFASAGYLAIAYWICLAVIINKENWRWYFGVSAFVCFYITLAKDVMLFSYPLIACLACHRLPQIFSGENAGKLSSIIILIIFSGFGFITLIKGSILPLYFILVIFMSIFFLYKKMAYWGVLSIISFFTSIVIFWAAAGQPLSFLMDYFSSMFLIISGYSEAMSTHGPTKHIVFYIAAYVMLMFSFCRNANISNSDKLFIALICLLIGFSAFKAGFVRHDAHATTAACILIFISAGLAAVFRPKKFFIAILLCGATWLCIDANYWNTSSMSVYSKVSHIYINQPKSFLKWSFRYPAQKKFFNAYFYATLKSIQNEVDLPLFSGTSDIYSYNQTDLLASGNLYNPRPIFQGYSAYTPKLCLANRAHLLSPSAPDNVFFRVETIDQRLPSLDDGASWPVLLSRYRFERLLPQNIALLRKMDKTDLTPPPCKICATNMERLLFGRKRNRSPVRRSHFCEHQHKTHPFGKGFLYVF